MKDKNKAIVANGEAIDTIVISVPRCLYSNRISEMLKNEPKAPLKTVTVSEDKINFIFPYSADAQAYIEMMSHSFKNSMGDLTKNY